MAALEPGSASSWPVVLFRHIHAAHAWGCATHAHLLRQVVGHELRRHPAPRQPGCGAKRGVGAAHLRRGPGGEPEPKLPPQRVSPRALTMDTSPWCHDSSSGLSSGLRSPEPSAAAPAGPASASGAGALPPTAADVLACARPMEVG